MPQNNFQSDNHFEQISNFDETIPNFGTNSQNNEHIGPQISQEYYIRGGALEQHSNLNEPTFGIRNPGGPIKSPQNGKFHNYVIHHRRNLLPKEGKDNIQIFPRERNNFPLIPQLNNFPLLPHFNKEIPHEYANIQPTIENFADQFKHEIPQGAPYKGPVHKPQKPQIHHKPDIYHEPEVYHEHEVYHEPVDFHHKPEAYHEPEVYHEHEGYREPIKYHKPDVYHEPEVYHEHQAYHEPIEYHEPEIYHEPEVYHEHQGYREPIKHHQPDIHYEPEVHHRPEVHHQPEVYHEPEVYHKPVIEHKPPRPQYQFQDEFGEINKETGILI